jgi:hypothetical protein
MVQSAELTLVEIRELLKVLEALGLTEAAVLAVVSEAQQNGRSAFGESSTVTSSLRSQEERPRAPATGEGRSPSPGLLRRPSSQHGRPSGTSQGWAASIG